MRSRRVRSAVIRPIVGALVVALAVAGLGWLAPPAQAAVSVDLKASSGTVGVAQNLTVSVGATGSSAQTGKVTITADGKSVGSKAVGGDQGTTITVPWTPTATGPVTLRAIFESDSDETAADQLTVQVNPVSTTTSLSVPATAAASAKVSLLATVQPKSGTYVPTGTVTFRLTNGTTLGKAPLNDGATATLAYTTPSTAGTLTIVAVYAGDGRASISTSANASLKVSTTAATLTLTVPTSTRVGASTELVAKITPAGATGSIAFTANGTAIGNAKPSNGTARLAWKPTAPGTVTIVASYPGAGGVGSATATAKVRVDPALAADTITVTPSGSATPWSPSTVVALANGSRVELVAASASKLPVQLAVTGPCGLSASTLVVKGVGGSCVLTASPKGNGTYAPASQKFTVSTGVGRQTANLAAPASRSVPRHSSLRLGRIRATTDIGQPITWRVTTGASRCHIKRTMATFRVVFSRAGTCRVRATAPGVPGQWAPFSAYRTYRIR